MYEARLQEFEDSFTKAYQESVRDAPSVEGTCTHITHAHVRVVCADWKGRAHCVLV